MIVRSPFIPPDNQSQFAHFSKQINLIKMALNNGPNNELITERGFDLDHYIKFRNNFASRKLFSLLNEEFSLV